LHAQIEFLFPEYAEAKDGIAAHYARGTDIPHYS
jgi:hypothetical protein